MEVIGLCTTDRRLSHHAPNVTPASEIAFETENSDWVFDSNEATVDQGTSMIFLAGPARAMIPAAVVITTVATIGSGRPTTEIDVSGGSSQSCNRGKTAGDQAGAGWRISVGNSGTLAGQATPRREPR